MNVQEMFLVSSIILSLGLEGPNRQSRTRIIMVQSKDLVRPRNTKKTTVHA